MSPRTKNWLLANWPLVAVAASALVGWGSLQARMSQFDKDVAVAKTDHDLLIKVSTDTDTMKMQLGRIEGKLDKVKESTDDDLPPNSGIR